MPVRIEFKRELVQTMNFPGTSELLNIIRKCDEFWKNSHNGSIDEFISKATKTLKSDKLYVLQISDFIIFLLKAIKIDSYGLLKRKCQESKWGIEFI